MAAKDFSHNWAHKIVLTIVRTKILHTIGRNKNLTLQLSELLAPPCKTPQIASAHRCQHKIPHICENKMGAIANCEQLIILL